MTYGSADELAEAKEDGDQTGENHGVTSDEVAGDLEDEQQL